MIIVGYEGGTSTDENGKELPLLWGAAAAKDERGVYNAVLGGGQRLDEEEWEEIVRDGSAAKTEVPIEIPDDTEAAYVLNIRKDLAAREPYYVEDMPEIYGVAGVAHGTTRSYYVFQSHERLSRWLYLLHARAFVLTSSDVP